MMIPKSMRSQNLFSVILFRESGGASDGVTGNFTSKVVSKGLSYAPSNASKRRFQKLEASRTGRLAQAITNLMITDVRTA